jgi:WhiB family redox-sensing transcriptional regulator
MSRTRTIDALLNPPKWQVRANCAGMATELFFPERGEPHTEAKAVCDACEVKVECLEFALSSAEQYGIWGGYSERARRKMRRQRRQVRLGTTAG